MSGKLIHRGKTLSHFPDKVFPDKVIDKNCIANLIQEMCNCKVLRILTGKKQHQMKLQRLQKVQIQTFELLVQ